MKHPVAVAILTGYNAALAQEIQNGNITMLAAQQAGRFAMAVAMEYLKGNMVFGQKFENFGADGEKLDQVLSANDVNMQKWNGA